MHVPADLPPPFHVTAYDVLGSTSDEAKALAAAGAPHGTAVWAAEQTKGRGRLDRVWASPPGNLYFSVVLRPSVSAARAPELGFVSAVAVADCIASFLPCAVPVRVKWPNDVLAEGRKIAGILLEAETTARGNVDWVVLGIGINVATHPEDTGYPAASLHRLTPLRPTVETTMLSLCRHLQIGLERWQTAGFGAIRQRWLDRAQGIGQPIELRQGGAILFGRFRDIDRDGALLLDTPAGPQRVSAGDVHFPAA